jgi:SAM-dependent methyltransferase
VKTHPEYGPGYFEKTWTSKSPRAADRYVGIVGRHIGAKPARILDVGCGTGVVLDRLERVEAWNSFGVDISMDALMGRAVANGRAAVADASRLPFAEETFDAVLLFDVIEHVKAPPLTLMEARRVSREGATLMMTTPNSNSPFRPLMGARWHGLRDRTHLCFFTSFTLGHLIRQTGWTVLSSGTTSGGPQPLQSLFQMLGVGGELYVVARAI